VLVQLEHLMSYAVVRTRVLAGMLRLNAWWFDIASDNMYAYNRPRRSFEIIDRHMVDRLAAHLAMSFEAIFAGDDQTAVVMS
jgi:carbonic anhydrase